MAQPDKPTIPQPRRSTEELDHAIELLRADILCAEDHGRDSHRLRGHLDHLLDEKRTTR